MKRLWHLLLPMVVGLGAGGTHSDLEAWQGAWVIRDGVYPGSVQAWRIQGNSVVIYDPTTHRREGEQFALQSPCRLVHIESTGGGDTIVATNTFAFANDGLHVGPPQAAGGIRRGTMLMACVGEHVYTLDTRTGRCRMQSADMTGSPMPTQGECAVVGTPPAFVLRGPEGAGKDVWLNFAGDALLSPALTGSVSEKQTSFEAAIRRADVLAKSNQ